MVFELAIVGEFKSFTPIVAKSRIRYGETIKKEITMIKNRPALAGISAKIRTELTIVLASAVLVSSTASFTAYAQSEQKQALYDIAKNVSAEKIEKDIDN